MYIVVVLQKIKLNETNKMKQNWNFTNERRKT